MAKDWLKLYTSSKETMIAEGILPFTTFSTMNMTGVRLKEFPIQGFETENTTPPIEIQRLKRPKAKTHVQKKPSAAGAGDNWLATLNAADELDWDTVTISPTVKKLLAIRMNKRQNLDILEGTPYQDAINTKTRNRLVDHEEMATSKIWAAATLSTALTGGKIDLTKAQETVDAIDQEMSQLEFLSDEFKHMSDGIIAVVHPYVAALFAKIQGTTYHQGTNTFPNGFNTSFTYNGREYFVSKILNSVEGAAATEVAGAVLMDKEAFVSAGTSAYLTEINETLISERVIGHEYGELSAVIDAKRIKKFEMTLPTGAAKSAKVND